MKKHRKRISLFTLLLFTLSLMIPLAANATVTKIDIDAPPSVTGGDTFDVTGELTLDEEETQDLWLVGPGDTVTKGTVSDRTVTFSDIQAVPATYAVQTMTFKVVETANEGDAADADPITNSEFEISVPALKPAIQIAPAEVGDKEVHVTLSGLAEEAVKLTLEDNEGAELATIDVEAGKTTGTLFIEEPGLLADTQYTVRLAYDDLNKELIKRFTPTGIAPGTPASDASRLMVMDEKVKVNEDTTVNIALRDRDDEPVSPGPYAIYVWAEERAGQSSSALSRIAVDSSGTTYTNNHADWNKNVFRILVENTDTLEMRFARAGTYEVFASLDDPNATSPFGDVPVFRADQNRQVEVDTEPTTPDLFLAGIAVDSVNNPDNQEILLQNKDTYGTDTEGTLRDGAERITFTAENYRTLFKEDFAPITVPADDATETLIDFTLYQYRDTNEDGTIDGDERTLTNIEAVGAGKEITFSAEEGLRLDPTTATTNNNGVVRLAVTAETDGDYTITATAQGHSVAIPVKAGEPTPEPEPAKSVIMTIGSKTFIIDGKTHITDTAPLIRTDRTFVPYRALTEAFGAKVEWDDADRTVTVEQEGITVVMTIGSTEYTVDGVSRTMDVAPFIENDRTMIPVRFASEALGYEIDVTYHADGTTNQVLFTR